MCMIALSFAAPVMCGSGGLHLLHVQFLRAELWDKFMANLSNYQILRKKSTAFRYLSDFYLVTLSVESSRVIRNATGDSFVHVPSV
jgi:hypothetical protein